MSELSVDDLSLMINKYLETAGTFLTTGLMILLKVDPTKEFIIETIHTAFHNLADDFNTLLKSFKEVRGGVDTFVNFAERAASHLVEVASVADQLNIYIDKSEVDLKDRLESKIGKKESQTTFKFLDTAKETERRVISDVERIYSLNAVPLKGGRRRNKTRYNNRKQKKTRRR